MKRETFSALIKETEGMEHKYIHLTLSFTGVSEFLETEKRGRISGVVRSAGAAQTQRFIIGDHVQANTVMSLSMIKNA